MAGSRAKNLREEEAHPACGSTAKDMTTSCLSGPCALESMSCNVPHMAHMLSAQKQPRGLQHHKRIFNEHSRFKRRASLA